MSDTSEMHDSDSQTEMPRTVPVRRTGTGKQKRSELTQPAKHRPGGIQTKIIATVGPASDTVPVLEKLIEVGVDVFRLNFSHGSHEAHLQAINNIRNAASNRGAIVAIMGDLSGPKIRLGNIDGGPRTLSPGDEILIVRETDAAGADRVGTNLPAFVDEVDEGDRILIDDGNVRLTVMKSDADSVLCVCEVGGVISDHKGVNLPDTTLSLPSLTPKDRIDVEFAVKHDLDFLALSFVRTPADLYELRSQLEQLRSDIPLVAKIEKPEAVECIGEIIQACDVLLVARGDLGVEMDVARVPLIQKDIVRQCAYAGRPVIIATQMLQSMVEQGTPTRAEVSDVANAILDAADAVMLSAETAVGQYPIEAVRVIHRIAEQTEPLLNRLAPSTNRDVMAAAMRVTSAVARGAALLARDLSSKAVAVWTRIGNTPRLLSKHRLDMPVLGVCGDLRICRRMAMYYGVIPIPLSTGSDQRVVLRDLDAELVKRGLAKPGDMSIVITGTQLTQPGSTNTLLIHLVGKS